MAGMEGRMKHYNKKYIPHGCLVTWITCFFSLLLIFIVFQIQSFTFYSSSHVISTLRRRNTPRVADAMIAKLRESVTLLPLKDLRYSQNPMGGNTWFMTSLNDTDEENETEYLYFPSEASKGRVLCLKGRNTKDGTKNSYALAWRESLPDSAILLEGLTFVSNTYYDHLNLWHGIGTAAPFVRWSMKNGCVKPTRWILYHWGELRFKMGEWLEHLMRANFGDVSVEGFSQEDGPYCFERAVVMRHDIGKMGEENKLKVFDLLRCKSRKFCELSQARREVNEKGNPIIRFTLLLRRGSRSFKDPTAVTEIFAKECARVDGCVFNAVQSEDLNFCDQVRVLGDTDIVASPHGAQLTNMLFMDRGSSVMEFFPKGWLEHAGPGQYAHHWMAKQTGMEHMGAWWDSIGEDCPTPKDNLQCFLFHKEGQVGHNETYFSEWAKKVLEQVHSSKLRKAPSYHENTKYSLACQC